MFKNYRIAPPIFFTHSGLLLVLAMLLTYFWVVAPNKDIIALVILSAISVLIVVFLALLCIWSLKIKVACKFILSSPTSEPSAGNPTSILVNFKPFALPPLCELVISLCFKGRKTSDIEIFTSGATSSHNLLTTKFVFPHRGLWELEQTDNKLADNFGILQYTWKMDNHSSTAIKVLPQKRSYRGLPILASTYKEGDSITIPMKRSGDYYDFKRYHPGDGSRRILWKVYARTQNLLARHPEESVTPAGIAVLYCLALTKDDDLAAAYTQYIQDLEQSDVEILASCLGADGKLARSSTEAKDLVTDSAFQAGYQIEATNTLLDFEKFEKTLTNTIKNCIVDDLIIFVSRYFFTNPDSNTVISQLTDLLSNKNIRPVFCYLEHPHELVQTSFKNSNNTSKIKQAIAWLFATDTKPFAQNDLTTNFIAQCKQKGWQLHMGTYLV